MFKLVFRKGRGTRNQIANICWIMEKARKFQKNIYFCFLDYAKAFDYVDHNKLWKILQEMGISDHLTCFLRNLYAGQEVTVRTGHGTICQQIWKTQQWPQDWKRSVFTPIPKKGNAKECSNRILYIKKLCIYAQTLID